MILKSPLDIPIQQKYKVANETLEGIEMFYRCNRS